MSRTLRTYSPDRHLAACVTTRTNEAFTDLDARREEMLAIARRYVRTRDAAEDVLQDVSLAILAMTPADLDTWRGNLHALVSNAARDARKKAEIRGRRESLQPGGEHDARVVEARSRRVEHDTWRRSGAMTPEKAAELSELRAMLPEREREDVTLTALPSTFTTPTIHESALEPMAQATMAAIVGLLSDGTAPTARAIADRSRLPYSGVRKYLTDLRRAGMIDATNNVLRMIDDSEAPARVEPEAKPSRNEHGMTLATERMFSAYVAIVRETGARPTIRQVVDRVEAQTGHHYGDTKRPFAALRAGGWLEAETGAVLRTIDGREPPMFASEIVIEDAVETADIAPAPVAEIDEVERARRSLITPDPAKRPFVVVPGMPLIVVPTMPALARRWAMTEVAPSLSSIASRASGLEPQRVASVGEDRPRLHLAPAPCAPPAGCEPPRQRAPILATGDIDGLAEPARIVVDWDGWDESRARSEAERLLSIGRDAEDIASELDPTDAGFLAPVGRRRRAPERVEELRFPDPDDPGGGRRRKKKRRA